MLKINHLYFRLLGSSSLAAVLISTAPVPALAQTGPGLRLEEIVVTARKREESLQNVPVAVAAFTQEDIQVRGLATIVDVGAFTPNAKLESGTTDVGGAANATFFIRGIGQLDYAPTTDLGVGLYVDGVYMGRAQGAVLEMTDIERVEILKGPQGTLFGKNTMGGAINVKTLDPQHEFSGTAGIRVGEDERFDVDFGLNAPLGDKFAARISASYRSQDGYVRRPLVGDKDGEEGTFAGRAKFLYEPTAATRVLLSLDYTNIDADANVGILNFNEPAGLAALWNAFVGFPSGAPLASEFTAPDIKTSFGTGSSKLKYEGGGASLRIDHDFDAVSVRSITAYRTFDSRNQRDNDSSPVSFGELDYRDDQWQISQEFNLFGRLMNDRLRYTAGLYYFQEKAESDWAVDLAPGLFEAFESLPGPVFPVIPTAVCPGDPLCAGGPGNPLNIGFDIGGVLMPEVKSKSYAAFLDLEFQLTDSLAMIVGGRVTRDEKDFSYLQTRSVTGIPTVPLTTASGNWTNFSPRAGLSFQPNQDQLYYVSVSTGYKAGGFNARPANPDVVRRLYDPEKLVAYEAGSKLSLLDRRIRLNTAVFYYDYKNIQLMANDLIGTQIVQVIDNVGKSRLWGAEAELQWLLAEGLTFFGGVGYLNAKYKETQEEITGVMLDSDLPKAPEWSATASLEYRTQLFSGEALIRADYSYVSENFADVRNTPYLRQEPHSLVNARLAWTTANGSWTVAGYGRNIFNERFALNGFDFSMVTGTVLVIPNQPRELGFEVISRF